MSKNVLVSILALLVVVVVILASYRSPDLLLHRLL